MIDRGVGGVVVAVRKVVKSLVLLATTSFPSISDQFFFVMWRETPSHVKNTRIFFFFLHFFLLGKGPILEASHTPTNTPTTQPLPPRKQRSAEGEKRARQCSHRELKSKSTLFLIKST
eukprot:TRINITY_DN16580_c0_g1_i1.p1 TRINITY_DN16580_c0_g1~~TRINITY_DN16580_c0_g1_i1.p1  ORF type:complete len:118 (-),score=2.87 TRINITY_DN16580_c0_g1_i1:417-770(-)